MTFADNTEGRAPDDVLAGTHGESRPREPKKKREPKNVQKMVQDSMMGAAFQLDGDLAGTNQALENTMVKEIHARIRTKADLHEKKKKLARWQMTQQQLVKKHNQKHHDRKVGPWVELKELFERTVLKEMDHLFDTFWLRR